MVSPKKRPNKPLSAQNSPAGSSRYTPSAKRQTTHSTVDDAGNKAAATEVPTLIPHPPTSCEPWHFFWCDGHQDWHHHDEFVVTAIQRTLASGESQ